MSFTNIGYGPCALMSHSVYMACYGFRLVLNDSRMTVVPGISQVLVSCCLVNLKDSTAQLQITGQQGHGVNR